MTHQGKWGFYPCNREVFLKLKKLNAALERARRQVACWGRWERKDPHNRIVRKRIRNSKGQVVGYQPPKPMPEPALCPAFTQKGEERTNWTKSGYHTTAVAVIKVRLVHEEIADEYRKARYPVASPELVTPLSITEAEIDRLLALVK